MIYRLQFHCDNGYALIDRYAIKGPKSKPLPYLTLMRRLLVKNMGSERKKTVIPPPPYYPVSQELESKNHFHTHTTFLKCFYNFTS